MVRVGLGRWAASYAPQRTDLRDWEEEARTAQRGLWGDATGANVALPPSLADQLRSTPVPKPVATPRPGPTKNATPAIAAAPKVKSPAAPTKTAAPRPISLPRVTDIALPALFFFTAFFFALLHWKNRDSRSILPQLCTATIFAIGATMLLPLPILLMNGRFQVSGATVVAGITGPVAAFGLWFAAALGRREQILRATALRPIAELTSGFVRVAGQTTAPNGLAESTVGRIPGIYIKEVTWRYEADLEHARGQGRKRVVPHRWIKKQDETRTADFVLTDDSGSVAVDAEHAKFYPLRVARFYNDMPIEHFFEKPYSGDVRTEVFFIPATANLTVWGRAYRTASPIPGESEERIGSDTATVGLIIVEENPARVYSKRASLSLLLTLAAIALAAVAAYAILSPKTFDTLLRPLFGGYAG
jgi:hypothetical protein